MGIRMFGVAILVLASPMAAQEMKHEMHGSGWKEMDAFHMVMGGTFHPAQAKGDLKPIRAKAGELASRAEAWAKSVAPKRCATDEIKAQVAQIVTETKALADLVAANGADDAVKAALTGIHDKFEPIEEKCASMKH